MTTPAGIAGLVLGVIVVVLLIAAAATRDTDSETATSTTTSTEPAATITAEKLAEAQDALDYFIRSGSSFAGEVKPEGEGVVIETDLFRDAESGPTARGACVTVQSALGEDSSGQPVSVRVLGSDGGPIVSMRNGRICTVVAG